MLFRGKAISDVTETDLDKLIGDESESLHIDFKQDAYFAPPEAALQAIKDQRERDRIKNEWKVKLCTDLSAIANASGGWIVCGMKEVGGIASEICGLGVNVKEDDAVERLEQAANSGIEPMIPGLRLQPIKLADVTKSTVIVIYIPRSFRAPHRVKETRKFHVRRSNRNDEMNIDELRTAFNLAENFTERIKIFRKARVEAIAIDGHEDVPVFLRSGVQIILHSIPLNMTNPSSLIDLSVVFQERYPAMWVAQRSLHKGRFNLEGFVIPEGEHDKKGARGYTQIYRNGTIECVGISEDNEAKIKSLPQMEDWCLSEIERALFIQNNLKIELPLVIMLSICHTKGYRFTNQISEDPFYSKDNLVYIHKNEALIPSLVIESYEVESKLALKPLFDILWNLGGWEKSGSYDENGNWLKRRN